MIHIGTHTREYLRKAGLPEGDLFELPPSAKRFDDGSHYRIEQSGADTPRHVAALIEGGRRHGFPVHRLVETRGIMRLADDEIREMCAHAREAPAELFLSVGPRAVYDTSATRRTAGGGSLSNRLRGADMVVWAIEDIRRALSLGVRGIMVYDEGLLWLLKRMRADGEFPVEFAIKVSAHVAAANPFSVKLLEELGASTVNIVRDFTLPALAAIRAAVEIPLDTHTDSPQESGGFIRTYEVPTMVEVGAPVYLKAGTNAAAEHLPLMSDAALAEMSAQTARVWETLQTYAPDLRCETPSRGHLVGEPAAPGDDGEQIPRPSRLAAPVGR